MNAVNPIENDGDEEPEVVRFVDAVVQYITMMVEVVHASIAFCTVFCRF